MGKFYAYSFLNVTMLNSENCPAKDKISLIICQKRYSIYSILNDDNISIQGRKLFEIVRFSFAVVMLFAIVVTKNRQIRHVNLSNILSSLILSDKD